MKTPSYRLEDYENTYEYHRDFRPQEVFTRNAYRLIRRISQPHVAYQSGSREMLDALDQEAVPLILPINHLSNLHDQWTAAAVRGYSYTDAHWYHACTCQRCVLQWRTS